MSLKAPYKLLLLLTLFFLGHTTYGQKYNFRHYDVQDGLPQSQVNTIHQDSRGYLWLGTFGGGVSRFDGHEFVHFNETNGLASNSVLCIRESEDVIYVGTTAGLSIIKNNVITSSNLFNWAVGNRINSILTLRNGEVWLGVDKGIISYNATNGIEPIPYSDFESLVVRELYEDSKNRIWVLTNENGLFRIEDGKVISINKTFPEIGLKPRSISEGQDGSLWIATSGDGIFLFEDERMVKVGLPDHLGRSYFTSSSFDTYGNLWLGTWGSGAIKYDGKEFKHFTKGNGLRDNAIKEVYCDAEGNIWMGFYTAGTAIFLGDVFTSFNTSQGLPDNDIRSLYQDELGTIWAATAGGLGKFDENGFVAYYPSSDIIHSRLGALVTSPAGDLCLGTYSGRLISFKDGRFTIENDALGELLALYKAKDGTTWAGTFKSGLIKLSPEKPEFIAPKELEGKSIWCISEDQSGRLWIGTDKGVYFIENDSLTPFRDNKILSESIVYSIIVDDQGRMYFGTYGNGIIRFTPSDRSFEHINTVEGFPSNFIKSLIISDNTLYAASINGLYSIDIQNNLKDSKGTIKSREVTIGMNKVEFNPNSIIKDNTGKLWLGTTKGVLVYNPTANRSIDNHQHTLLTDIRLFSEKTDWSNLTDSISDKSQLPASLTLPNNKNHLTFEFSGIHFFSPQRIRYQYKLEGFDFKWSDPGKASFATYSNIPPGEYIFKVRSGFAENIENQPVTEFAFTVEAPFWKSLWFFFTIMFVLVVFGFLIFFFFSRQQVTYVENDSIFNNTTSTSRTILLFGSVVYSVAGYLYHYIVPSLKTPYWEHAAFSIVFFIFFLLSYVSSPIRKRLPRIVEFCYYSLVLHIMYVCFLNQLHPIYIIALVLAINTVNIILDRMTKLIVFSAITLVASALIALIAKSTEYNVAMLVIGVVIANMISILIFLTRQSIFKELSFSDSIVNNTNNLVLGFNQEGEVVFANPRIKDMLGYDKWEILGNKWWELAFENAEERSSAKQQMINSGSGAPFETKITVKSGGQKYLLWETSKLPSGIVVAIAQDISSAIETQKELEQLSTVASKTTSGVVILDENSKVEWFNDSYARISGYSLEEMRGIRPSSILSGPETDRESLEEIDRKVAKKHSSEAELLIYNKEGKEVWIHVSNTPVVENGKVVQQIEIVNDITEKKVYEEQLEELSLVASKTTSGVAILNADGEIDWFNESYKQMFGYELDELKGKKPGDMLSGPGSDFDIINEGRRLSKEHKGAEFEILAYHKDGFALWMSVLNTLVFDKNGKLIKQIEIVNDITEKKVYEEQLEELSLVASKTDNYVIIANEQDEITWVNEGFTRISGFEFSEVVGRKVGDVLRGSDTSDETIKRIEYKSSLHLPFTDEILNYSKTGEKIWFSMNVTPVLGENDKLEKFITIGRNISEQKEREQQLQELSIAINKAQNGVAITDEEGCINWINEGFIKITGYGYKELLGKKAGDVVLDEKSDLRALEYMREQTKKGESYEKEFLIRHQQGQLLWVSINSTVIKDEKSASEKRIEIITDVTARKKAEERLNYFVEQLEFVNVMDKVILQSGSTAELVQKTIEELQKKLNTKRISISLLEKEGSLITTTGLTNGQNEFDTHSISKQEVATQDLLSKHHEKDPFFTQLKGKNQTLTVLPDQKFDQGLNSILIYPLVNQNLLLGTLNLAREKEGGFSADEIIIIKEVVNALSLSISQVILQEELITSNDQLAQKNEEFTRVNRELKEFAYVVSHDLKAPLRAIGSLSNWIFEDNKEKLDEQGKAQITMLQSRVKRMSGLIDGILQYSKLGRIREQKKQIDTGVLLEEVIKLLAPPPSIKVVIEPDMPLIRGEEIRIMQLFQNLVSNSIKYMDKEKGQVEIGYLEHAKHWEFYIKDNGPGIDEKYFDKIFKIFQTLQPKDEMESTGIGLAIVKKIVEQHNGEVWLESTPGHGTTFFFTIQKSKTKTGISNKVLDSSITN